MLILRSRGGRIPACATRRKFLAGLFVLPVIAVVGLHPHSRADRPQRHHFIVIVVDTLRRDALGCYGSELGASPYIDALAAEGVRFDQAISTSGWTLPAIASLLTGTWPELHGAKGTGVDLTPIRTEVATAPEILKARGFATLGLGNAAFVSPLLHFDRGFDVYDHRHAFNREIRRADETIRTALDMLREHRDESVFLFVHVFDPHLDYDPPEGYRTKFTAGRNDPPMPLSHQDCVNLAEFRAPDPLPPEDLAYVKGVYLGEVNFVDAQIGVLVKELKALGTYDQTTLVITSDHGEEFWDHGGFEHGHTLYDELIHIPLIMKLPRGTPARQKVVPAQVRNLDIVPTLFDLAGIALPPSFRGASLLPVIAGQPLAHLTAFSQSVRIGPERLVWRTGSHKLIVGRGPAANVGPELYAWPTDPGERHNLASSEPALLQQLSRDLAQFYRGLQGQARDMTQPSVERISPATIEQLRSLGYIH